MTRRSKGIIGGILLAVIVIGIAIALIIFFVSPDGMRVRALDNHEFGSVEDYRNSRMHTYNSTRTFSIRLVRSVGDVDTIFFVGIGTFERTSDTYYLTFIDAWVLSGGTLARDDSWINDPIPADRLRRGRIEFIDDLGRHFIFG